MTHFRSTMWDLIEEAGKGQQEALKEFVLRYRSPVVAFIRSKGFREEAEDLAQEVFMKLFEKNVLEEATPAKGRFRNLLLSISRNVAISHLRKLNAQKRGGGRVFAMADFDVPDDQPDDDFDQAWTRHLVKEAMKRLSKDHPNYYEALRLFVVENQTYEEIIEATGTKKEALKHHIHRGKKKLAAYIHDAIRNYCLSNDDFAEELDYMSKYYDLGEF